MDDKEILERYLRGDKDAIGKLVGRYQQELFYTVKAVVFDREDAKDITQDAFIRALSRSFEGHCAKGKGTH